jgi:hypothetical protein
VNIVDTHPDTTPPVLSEVSLQTHTADVRSSDQKVVITARISDAESGVDPGSGAMAYLYPPDATGAFSTDTGPVDASWERTGGDDHNGTYQATLDLPKGTVGGTWTMRATLIDRAHADTEYWGPDGYAYYVKNGRSVQQIPDGTVDVTSTAPAPAPTVSQVRIDHTSIDGGGGAGPVRARRGSEHPDHCPALDPR